MVRIEKELPSFWNEFNVEKEGFSPKWIIVHHSFSTDAKTRDWDGIRKYHMSYRYQGNIISQGVYENYLKDGKTNGLEKPWKDVGYHFGIETVGDKLQVMAGRKIGETGAHCQGFNARSVGICCIGNYDVMAPSSNMTFFAISLCRQLQLGFAIPRSQVIGHRESYAMLVPPMPVQKSCPGKQFDMNEFRKRLRD